ncbi:MAG: hypothetical protein AAGA67_02915, partial [Cyanobacteria bacterium P01_F01_bin.153]
GFLPLQPFVAWSPVRVSDEERAEYLSQLDQKLQGLFDEPPIHLPRLEDFPNFGPDQQERFMVTVRRKQQPDEEYMSLVEAELMKVKQWKRDSILLDIQVTDYASPDWQGFILMRSRNREAVERHLNDLPLARYLTFEIAKLGQSII